MDLDLAFPHKSIRTEDADRKHPSSRRRGNRITVDSALYVLRQAMDHPTDGVSLNRLARRKYGSYRDASVVVNRLVECGMLSESITRDNHQVPRVTFLITEKGRTTLEVFNEW